MFSAVSLLRPNLAFQKMRNNLTNSPAVPEKKKPVLISGNLVYNKEVERFANFIAETLRDHDLEDINPAKPDSEKLKKFAEKLNAAVKEHEPVLEIADCEKDANGLINSVRIIEIAVRMSKSKNSKMTTTSKFRDLANNEQFIRSLSPSAQDFWSFCMAAAYKAQGI